MVIILVTMVTITTVISSRVKIYMLFAGWEVRIVKNCDRGLENWSQFFTIRTDLSR